MKKKPIIVTSQNGQKLGQPKKINQKIDQFLNKNIINNKYMPTHPPWPPTYLFTTHLNIIHLHTCVQNIYDDAFPTP
jgi:hypothetical protein